MKKKGITIIEFLTVIIIISIILGIGISIFFKYEKTFGFKGDVSELINDLNYTKQISIAEQINHGIRFDFYNNSYQIIRYGDEEEVIKLKEFPSETKIESIDNYSEVKFTFFGAVFKGGKILLKDDSFSRIIEIKPSGFIYVERDNIN